MGLSGSGIIKIFKPICAGMALAFLVTALVDGPAPVHFQPENPYAAKQAEIVGPQATLVIERNIMKLGSPLSVKAAGDVVEPVKDIPSPHDPEAEVITGNTVESELPPDPEPAGSPTVKGEVTEVPES